MSDDLSKGLTIIELALVGAIAYFAVKTFKDLSDGAYKLGQDMGKKVQEIEDNAQSDAQYKKWLAEQGGRVIPTGGDPADKLIPVVIPAIDPKATPAQIAADDKKLENIQKIFSAWDATKKQLDADIQVGKEQPYEGFKYADGRVYHDSVSHEHISKPGDLLSPVKDAWNTLISWLPNTAKPGTQQYESVEKSKSRLMVTANVKRVNMDPISMITIPEAKSINASDIPKLTFEATRDYLGKLPNGTQVLQDGQLMGTVQNGGVVRLDGKTYYTGSTGTGNTPQGVYDLLHPVIGTTPATPAVYAMPGGNVLAGNATTVPKEATVLIPAAPATEIRAQPITAYVPPATQLDTIAANPAMGSTPGIVYVNWQNYQVSKVPISGFGWIQMTEAEAKTRGFIK